jgi:hypothetical protein
VEQLPSAWRFSLDGRRSGILANYQDVMMLKSWAHRSWCVDISVVESSAQ